MDVSVKIHPDLLSNPNLTPEEQREAKAYFIHLAKELKRYKSTKIKPTCFGKDKPSERPDDVVREHIWHLHIATSDNVNSTEWRMYRTSDTFLIYCVGKDPSNFCILDLVDPPAHARLDDLDCQKRWIKQARAFRDHF